MVLEQVMPAFLVNALGWRARFRSAGFRGLQAWTRAFSRDWHRSLWMSRFEQLPADVRSILPVVVDVGANHGQWITSILRFAAVRRVEIFEPIPRELAQCRNALGSRTGVNYHPEALGDSPGVGRLRVLRQSDLTSFLAPSALLKSIYSRPELDAVETLEVPITTLDLVLRDDEPIDLLKIDVQGTELAVLRGAKRALQRTRMLLIETNLASHYVGDDNFLGLGTALVKEFQFEVWDLSNPTHNTDGRALWCDTVFLNRAMLGR